MAEEIEFDFSVLYGPGGVIAWNKIPEAMQQVAHWVLWKIEIRVDAKGVEKPTKVPYTIYGARAKSNDPATWATFDEVRKAYKFEGEYSGIGFVFTSELGIIGIDLDHCLEYDAQGKVSCSPMARMVLEQVDSYTEVSPSGTGLHIICRAGLPPGRRKDQRRGFEIYANVRFFTITGDRWPGTKDQVEDCTAEVSALYTEFFGSGSGSGGSGNVGGRDGVDSHSGDGGGTGAFSNNGVGGVGGDYRIISDAKAKLLSQGHWAGAYPSQSEADMALAIAIAAKLDNPTIDAVDRLFRQTKLYRKDWDRTGRRYTIPRAIAIVESIGKRVTTNGVSHAPHGQVQEDAAETEVEDLEQADLADGFAADVDEGWPDSGDVAADPVDGVGGRASDDGGMGDWDDDHNPWDSVDPGSLPLTDTGNAERLACRYGDILRFVPQLKEWLIWNGFRWKKDDSGEIITKCTQTVRQIHVEASLLPTAAQRQSHGDWATKSEGEARIMAMERLARAQPSLRVDIGRLDRDVMLLNCVNGTLDLHTGLLRDPLKSDFITNCVPVAYDVTVDDSEWRGLVLAWTGGDLDFAAFLQRAVGYSLSGDVSEEKLFLVYGGTETGKSTFFIALRAMMASYAKVANFESFIATKNSGGPRDDLADLAGSRLVVSVEVGEGSRLAENLVKQLTGGDPLKARHLYKPLFEFIPTFKFWLAANYAPVIRSGDAAIWRRILRLPFDIPMHRDPMVKKRARAGYYSQQILKWAVEGSQEWLKQGLNPPSTVIESTEKYKEETDVLAEFIENCCVVGDGFRVRADELYRTYRQFEKENGLEEKEILSGNLFGRKMTLRFGKRRDIRGIWYVGLGLIGEQNEAE